MIRAERILKAGLRRRSSRKYVNFISLRLRGNASIWFSQLKPHVLKEYKLFKAAFLATFQTESTATHGATLRALESMHQRAMEALSSYHIRFCKGVRDLEKFGPIGDVQTTHRYVLGLKKEYQDKASWYQKKDHHLTLADLHAKMLKWELHVRERTRGDSGSVNAIPPPKAASTKPPPPSPTSGEGLSVQEAIAALSKEVQELRGQVQRGTSTRTTAPPWKPEYDVATGDPICSSCREVGHIRRNCPARQRRREQRHRSKEYCEYHQVFGHTTRNCRAKGRQDANVGEKKPVVAGVNLQPEVPDPAAQQQDFQ